MKKTMLMALLMIVTALVNVACDQATKVVAKQELYGKPPISMLGGTFVLVYAENKGAFLGLYGKMPDAVRSIMLVWFPIAACLAGLIYIIVGKNLLLAERLLLASVIGGGVGNLIDRISAGFVVDFMNFGIGPVFRTGILNFADISITFGFIFFILVRMVHDHKMKKQQSQAAG